MATIKIGGELESLASDGIVVSSNHIVDREQDDKKQSVINKELYDSIASNANSINNLNVTMENQEESISTCLDLVAEVEPLLVEFKELFDESFATHLDLINSNTDDIKDIKDSIKETNDTISSNKEELEEKISSGFETAEDRINSYIEAVDSIKDLENFIGYCVGVGITLTLALAITATEPSSNVWALIGDDFTSLKLYNYYLTTNPFGGAIKTWIDSGKTFNMSPQISSINTRLTKIETDHNPITETAYEALKTSMGILKDRFYFTYEEE